MQCELFQDAWSQTVGFRSLIRAAEDAQDSLLRFVEVLETVDLQAECEVRLE